MRWGRSAKTPGHTLELAGSGRDTGGLLDGECGRRAASTLTQRVARLAPWEVTFCCADQWPVSAAVIAPARLILSNARTAGIERTQCRQRHGFGRFKRQSMMVSKAKERIELTMALLARFRVHGDVAEIFTLDMITSTILSR